MTYVSKKKICEVRSCKRPARFEDERLGSLYCEKHMDVWQAETDAIMDHTLRATGSRLDANATHVTVDVQTADASG